MRTKTLAVAIASTVFAQAGTARPVAATRTLIDECKFTRSIAVRRQTTFVITLPGNAGTGYSWQIVHAENARLASPLEVVPDPKTPPGTVGGRTTSIIRVKFDRRGPAVMLIGLAPPGRERWPDKIKPYCFSVR